MRVTTKYLVQQNYRDQRNTFKNPLWIKTCDHLVHVTKEIDVGEVAFTGSGPVLTQEMLKQVKNEQWLDIFQNS